MIIELNIAIVVMKMILG